MTKPVLRSLRHYTRWGVFLHTEQYFLGRSYVWRLQGGKIDLLDLPPRELDELLVALQDVRRAFTRAFNHHGESDGEDLVNYAWLCNHENHGHHGHMHVIPRYRKSRKFAGRVFQDGLWGQNYAPYPKQTLPVEVLDEIAEAMRHALL